MAFERVETASQSRRRPPGKNSGQGRVAAFAQRVGAGLRRRETGIVTAVAVLGGLLLLYAEMLDLYRIITPSGSVSNSAGSVRTGGDQHSWALAVMGVAAAAAAVLAYATRQRLPALAAAMLGVAALVVALAVDLPDVTASGVTTDLEVGDAEPAAGFWVELVGAVVLTVGAALLASILRRRDPARVTR